MHVSATSSPSSSAGAAVLRISISRHRDEHDPNQQSSKLAQKLRLNGTCPTPQGKQPYNVTVCRRYSLMFGAGVLSGLLGIGSGAVKVLAMDQAMKIPFKSRRRPAIS